MSAFKTPGSFARPGLVGRGLRLLFGAGCLYFLAVLFTQGSDLISEQVPTDPGWWVGMLVALWALPDVINIGFKLSLGRIPQFVAVGVLLALAALNLLLAQTVWSPLLGTLVLLWLIYVFAHLGVSFILAGALATPG